MHSSLLSLVAGMFALGIGGILLPEVAVETQTAFFLVFYMALAGAFNLTFGYTGYLPFGYAAFVGAGAYTFSTSILQLGFSPGMALTFSMIVGILCALITLPMLRIRGGYFAIASLVSGFIVESLVVNIDYIGGAFGVRLPPAIASSSLVYVLLVVVLVAVYVTTWSIEHSRVGLALKTLRDDPLVGSLVGVNILRYRALAWGTSAAFAGLLGGIYAWFNLYFFPESVFSVNFTVNAIIFTVFGGAGTVWGPLVGAAVLYTIYDSVGSHAPQLMGVLYGLIIMVLALYFDKGVMPAIASWARGTWQVGKGRLSQVHSKIGTQGKAIKSTLPDP